MADSKDDGRVLLPDALLPSRYDLRLTPDLEKFVFDGKVTITVEVSEAVDEVSLHARELGIVSASFKAGADGSGAVTEVTTISMNLKSKVLKLGFAEMLPVGPGQLEIEYTGILNDQMAGFYRSSYKDINGVSKIMASTQFEAIDARRCFPCWDEPGRKAVFAVTLLVDPALTAFSNMPEKASQLVKVGTKYLREIAFMDSPKMSTYLLAMVVGEFDFIQAQTEHGVLIRVYTPPGRSAAGTFALDVATKCLDLYDNFFGSPYPLPKLDMVAIPEFAAGAMENWGLVTYREVDLLIDPKTASNNQKQRVCIVVTHELAHQWFGNLVTMDWWNDLWLNEGFASWCENWAADKIMPSYLMWDQFLSDTLAAALRLDGLETSHPIQVPIKEAEEVEEVFDAVSYCKGASVIRMAHAVLGHDAFQKGLQAYMAKHKYGNTATFDLWAAWAEASGKPVKEIMSSWTEKMGYPVLQVKDFKIEGTKAKLSLEQGWFLTSGEPPKSQCTWKIPVFAQSGKETAPMVMMESQALDIEVPVAGADDFVLLNKGMQTPMRVLYTPDMRERLTKAVSSGVLPSVDRAMLLLDAYALSQAGKLGVDDLLRLLAAYSNEKEYTVWDAMSMVILGFQKILMGGAPPEVYKSYMEFCEMLVSKGWKATNPGFAPKPEDGHLSGLLRGLMMKLVARCAAGPEFLAEARQRFEKYVEDPKTNAMELPEEYRTPVLQVVLSQGGSSENARLMEAFKKLETNIEMKHIYLSVGFSSDMKLKEDALRWATSGQIKIQDFFYVFASVSTSSKAGLDFTWDFFRREFDTIHGMLKNSNASLMDACIEYSTAGYCTEEKATEIDDFFKSHPLPLNKRTISQVLEKTRNNAKFLKKVLDTDIVKPEFWSELKKKL
mmetsp:Transcript_7913/g.17501  ORF Transcript_7913/g.17501 Transcript_7913/m.17501 type:complete len:891 (+) Transcript_7913:76-2748(+)